MKIEFDKIITNMLSAVCVMIITGACLVVWKGATSVDDKVQNTREDMQHLINSLSDKLASYEVTLNSLSNQLNIVIKNQTNIVAKVITNSPPYPTIIKPDSVIQQKAYSQDIMRQLKR